MAQEPRAPSVPTSTLLRSLLSPAQLEALDRVRKEFSQRREAGEFPGANASSSHSSHSSHSLVDKIYPPGTAPASVDLSMLRTQR